MNDVTENVSVLLVEDDEIDAIAIKRALTEEGLGSQIVHAVDGIEALECLRGQNGRDKLCEPLLVLLDINMPRMNGHEFLTELSVDPALDDTVVFVLTTSDDQKDREAVYEKYADGYILKSDLDGDYSTLASMLKSYWTMVAPPA